MPYPPYRGDKLKIFNLGKSLRDKHEIHLITVAENKSDIEAVPHLEKVFHKIDYVYLPTWKSKVNVLKAIFSSTPFQIAYFKSAAFSKLLKDELEKNSYDAIHVQHLRMAQFIPDNIKKSSILDLPDAFSLYWKRRFESSTNYLTKIFNKIEYKRLDNFEKTTIPQYPKALVCSREDQRYLGAIPNSQVDLLQNGVDIHTFKPKEISFEKFRVLFTGNMDYAPNIDAVNYFVRDILPTIKQAIPQVQFIIAGQRPVSKVLQLANDHVKVTGFIEDLSEEYAKAHVVVSPLRIGAGTQNKVLEALSMNIPVVTTWVGYEGLELPLNIGALPSKDASEFADNVIKILRDENYRNEVGQKGGDLIRSKFSWEAIATKLEAYLKEVQSSRD
jgi:sugar transferase (PEP-CTERM/EpsH1 system associated)